MPRFPMLRFVTIVALLTLAAGCPSSRDGATEGDAARPAVEPPVETPAEPPVEPVQPAVQPTEQPAVQPTVQPIAQPYGAEVAPAGEPSGGPAAEPEDPTAGELKPLPSKDDPFDPVKENGPIFVGWTKPKLAMVISGRQDGYIEPCGCAGLNRMKGGMSRRHTMFKELRAKGWPVVGLDAGGIAKGFGRQAEMKFQIMVDGMRKMGYDAIALGKRDLRLPAAELLSVTASTADQKSPFVSANVALFGFDSQMTAQVRVIEAAAMKIGVTAVLGTEWQKEIVNAEIEMIAPETALTKIVPALRQQTDYLVLLAHATMEETLALAEKFPQFDLVVTAGGPAEPPATPQSINDGKTLLIEVGEKGMNAVVLGLYDDARQPLRYQRVPLDSRFKGSAEMKMLMQAYQDQLEQSGFAGLGIRPVPHPQQDPCGSFVGSEKCKSCHEESYDVWKKSGHAKAHKTLLDLDPARNFDPECVSCHVTGWHPTKHFPYESGYWSLETTPKLIDTGCESCHGPGSAHVKAENGGDLALQEKLQKAAVVTKEEAEKRLCLSCHDLDNSPSFDFETYWPHVEHHEDVEDE